MVDTGVGRLLAFTDGVFAIAITLLVLNVEIPGNLSDADYVRALHEVLPTLGAAALSFVIIGRFWMSHHRLFSYIRRVDQRLLQRNLWFLGPVVLLPFSTQLLASYGDTPSAVIIYAVTIAAAGLFEEALWVYAVRRRRLVHQALARSVIVSGLVRYGWPVIVFAASIPIALVSPTAAEYSWIALILPVWVFDRLRAGRSVAPRTTTP